MQISGDLDSLYIPTGNTRIPRAPLFSQGFSNYSAAKPTIFPRAPPTHVQGTTTVHLPEMLDLLCFPKFLTIPKKPSGRSWNRPGARTSICGTLSGAMLDPSFPIVSHAPALDSTVRPRITPTLSYLLTYITQLLRDANA